MVMGRPVGSTGERIWHKAIVKAVNQRKNGKGSPKKLELIANKCVDQAVAGESWAVKEVGDRLDGKPAQAIAIKGDPDSPVIFNLRLGDGMIDGGTVETIASEPVTASLIAISALDATTPPDDDDTHG